MSLHLDPQDVIDAKPETYEDYAAWLYSLLGIDPMDTRAELHTMLRRCPDCIEYGEEMAWAWLGLPYLPFNYTCDRHRTVATSTVAMLGARAGAMMYERRRGKERRGQVWQAAALVGCTLLLALSLLAVGMGWIGG